MICNREIPKEGDLRKRGKKKNDARRYTGGCASSLAQASIARGKMKASFARNRFTAVRRAKKESRWFSCVDERNVLPEWRPLDREKRFPRREGAVVRISRTAESSNALRSTKTFLSHDRAGNRHEMWWLGSTGTRERCCRRRRLKDSRLTRTATASIVLELENLWISRGNCCRKIFLKEIAREELI